MISSLRGANSSVGTVLLVLTAIYVTLTLLPFYGYGINERPLVEISASLVDPKGYFPFDVPLLGGLLMVLGLYGAHLVPALSLVLVPLYVLSLGMNWNRLRAEQRLLGAATVAVNAASLLLTWQSLWLIGFWLAD